MEHRSISPEIFKPIEATDFERHMESYKERLSDVMFLYAEKLMEETGNENFGDILYKNSPLFNKLQDRYSLARHNDATLPSTWEYMQKIEEQVNQIHSDHAKNWQQEIKKLIDEAENQWPPLPTKEHEHDPNMSAGLIKYNPKSDLPWAHTAGYSNEDEFIDVHFEPFFKSGKADLNDQDVFQSLSKLAEIIVDKYPQTRAVIGTSWLLSHPRTQILGFHPVDSPIPQNGMHVWLQFMDRNGQINERRVKQLLEAGQMPYPAAAGYIPIEEFLEKFLPLERRGEIHLKEIGPEYKHMRREMNEELEKLRNDWDSGQISDAKQYLEGTALVKKYLLQAGVLENFLSILSASLIEKLTWGQLKDKYSDEITQISHKLETEFAKDKYQNLNINIK